MAVDRVKCSSVIIIKTCHNPLLQDIPGMGTWRGHRFPDSGLWSQHVNRNNGGTGV